MFSTGSGFWKPGAVAGAALKLEASKIAETDITATARVIWSAEARAELLWRFFILFFPALTHVESSWGSSGGSAQADP
jgi:hypothetical protein